MANIIKPIETDIDGQNIIDNYVKMLDDIREGKEKQREIQDMNTIQISFHPRFLFKHISNLYIFEGRLRFLNRILYKKY